MKKYFIHSNGQNNGPYNVEELRMMGLTMFTRVWHEGLEHWKNAGEVPELRYLFFTGAPVPSPPPSFHQPSIFPPPPPSYYYAARQSQKHKPTKKRKLTVVLICLISVAGIAFFVFLLKKFDDRIELSNRLKKREKERYVETLPFSFDTSGVKPKQGEKQKPIKKKPALNIFHEEMPEFPGGTAAFHAFIRGQVKYPPSARDRGIQGTVYVRFTVEKSGEVTNYKILRGVSPELDREALRIIKNMPRWKPGKMNGNPVRIDMTQPIRFTLE